MTDTADEKAFRDYLKPDFQDDPEKMERQERASRVRQAISKAGGIRKVAQLSGIPLSSLSEYSSGRREAPISVLQRLAEAADVEPAWLAFGVQPEASMHAAPEAPAPSGPFGSINVDTARAALNLIDLMETLKKRRFSTEDRARMFAIYYAAFAKVDKDAEESALDWRKLMKTAEEELGFTR